MLLKSDGFPTYHLANVVDDHLMEITHVLRADEWLPSTPRHVLLYQALGYDPPRFAHLPMLLGKDKAKLSKRHGAVSILDYEREGYLPEAMFNFLGLLGWSLDDHTEIISREEFIKSFSLERVVKNPAVFDVEKLTWMNGVYMRELPPERLAELLAARLEEDLPPAVPRPLDRERLLKMVPIVQERIRLLDEAADMLGFFFIEGTLEYPIAGQGLRRQAERGGRRPGNGHRRLSDVEDWRLERRRLEETLRPLAAELGLKTGDLFMLLRVAVTGRTATPPLFETMEILGREPCLERLQDALRRLLIPDAPRHPRRVELPARPACSAPRSPSRVRHPRTPLARRWSSWARAPASRVCDDGGAAACAVYHQPFPWHPRGSQNRARLGAFAPFRGLRGSSE